MRRHLAGLLALMALAPGCSSVRSALGVPSPGDPSVAIKSAETRWLLIKNPRFGDVPSEPEYIWVEEDKLPTTLSSLVRGKSYMIAPPEIVAKYGTPPGGGKISPRQGVPYQTVAPASPAAGEAAPAAVTAGPDGAARPAA